MALLESEDAIAFMVAEGIAEIHEEQGDPLGACSELEGLLGNPNISARGKLAIRFKLRDIYKDAGQHKEALGQLKHISNTFGK